jgi:hypothetical protein
MGNTVRTSISVPVDLKARMDAVEESVNWSAVDCQAFENTLAEMIRRKGARDMEDTIRRLRASKKQADDERYTEGFEAGREWAASTAEAPELERLEKFRDDHRRRDEWRDRRWFSNGEDTDYTPGERLYSIIDSEEGGLRYNERDGLRYASQEFWEAALGDKAEKLTVIPSLVRGFAEGALVIWDEVKNKL